VQDTTGLGQVLLEATGGAVTLSLYGLGRLAEVEGADAQWFLADALGSVRQTVDDDGAVTLARDYTPFGVLRAEAGTGGSGYGYTGEQGALGLVYLRARWYDPYLNRFLSPDPIIADFTKPQSLNRYVYCLNDPVNCVDPSGLRGGPRFEAGTGYVSPDVPYDPDVWIAGFIRRNRRSIVDAANRHGIAPELLAAVLYLESTHKWEQSMQSLVGDWPQQTVKYLWNTVLPGTASDEYLPIGEWFPFMKGRKYEYFKLGRSQGVGAIKPEVAIYVRGLGLVTDPCTGEEMEPVDLDQWIQYEDNWVNTGKIQLMLDLADPVWSIEYLAAHLEAATSPKNPLVSWPDEVSRTSRYSEASVRLRVTYHHEVDNLVKWNLPGSQPYGAATNVLGWMPHMVDLLYSP
jgi:RHS repeat-associated protein